MTASFIDQVAVRKDVIEPSSSSGKQFSCHGVPYRAVGVDEDVFIHPSSVLFNGPPPEVVCYQELHRSNKAWLRGEPIQARHRCHAKAATLQVVTKISKGWLATLGKPLCTYSKVLETPDKLLAVGASSTGLKSTNDTREAFVVPHFAGLIDLPVIKATQQRVGSRWVFV